MPTTSNFGWTTPADTDLVKDGAAAIRTLGSGIDTSLVDLKGGTTGQILSKASNTDLDYTWIDNDLGDITEVTVSSPLTGGGSSGSVNVAIQDGTTAQKGAVQLEDSTSSTSTTKAATPNSVKSSYDLANAAIPKSLVDAAGDLIYATADNTVARLGIGTAGQVLKVNSGATAPEWGAAGSSGFVGVKCVSTSGTISIANNTVSIISWNSENFDTDAFHSTSSNTSRITIPSGKDGKYQIIAQLQYAGNATGQRQVRLTKNGTFTNATIASIVGTPDQAFQIVEIFDLVATDYIEVAAFQNSGGALNIDVSGTKSFLSANFLGA